MRSQQSYGDKQREAQQRKKQEELQKKHDQEGVQPGEVPVPDAEKIDQASKKKNKKTAQEGRSKERRSA
jgi:hypothetical protein